MLKHSPKYLLSKATTTPNKTWWAWMAAQQNQINLGKEYCIPLQSMVNWLPFLLFPGPFDIIIQSALESAIPLYVEVVRKRVFWEILHLGILSSTE